jgi:hypothetical protein
LRRGRPVIGRQRRCFFVQAELEFPRGKLIGLALTRQSASRRVACGTMTTNFDF